MSDIAEKKAVYADLQYIPENTTGQILNGELVVTPRPATNHSLAGIALSGKLVPPYHFGKGGPGGWVILYENEIMLGENLVVPDFSGWRKVRFPGLPDVNWISVPPDWVCEILSPSTARLDRVQKMPIYARHGVQFIWLIDPFSKTLEVFGLDAGKWVMLAAFGENDKVRAEPFVEIEIDLGDFWME